MENVMKRQFKYSPRLNPQTSPLSLKRVGVNVLNKAEKKLNINKVFSAEDIALLYSIKKQFVCKSSDLICFLTLRVISLKALEVKSIITNNFYR